MLYNLYMKDTCNDILDKIESKVKRVNSPNVIWIRKSSSVGKYVLVASITTQLQEQDQQVICFWFDHTESSTISTDAL